MRTQHPEVNIVSLISTPDFRVNFRIPSVTETTLVASRAPLLSLHEPTVSGYGSQIQLSLTNINVIQTAEFKPDPKELGSYALCSIAYQLKSWEKHQDLNL